MEIFCLCDRSLAVGCGPSKPETRVRIPAVAFNINGGHMMSFDLLGEIVM